MDFSLTPEQEAFRAEVRAWLSANLPPDWASRPIVTTSRAPSSTSSGGTGNGGSTRPGCSA